MRYPREFETALKRLLIHLNDLYDSLHSYQKVADYMGVTKGTIYQIMRRGHIPTKPTICLALGLPEIKKVFILTCPKCHKPQVANVCKCKPEKYPRMEKKKSDRVRVDIDATLLTEEEVEAIRNLDKKARTNILKLLADS